MSQSTQEEGPGFFNDEKVARIERKIEEEKEGIREDIRIMRRAAAFIRNRELVADLVELGQVLADPEEEPLVDSFEVEVGGVIGALLAYERALQDIEVRVRRIEALGRIREKMISRRGKRVYPLPE